MGWRYRWRLLCRLLYSRFDSVSNMAQTICGAVRGDLLSSICSSTVKLTVQQLLWASVQTIAATYPNSSRDAYIAAAQTFRVPYWDWALNATMPDLVNEPTISINTPSGSQVIVNPLYNYTFHPHPSSSEFPSGDRVRHISIYIHNKHTCRNELHQVIWI